ncbi:MAG: ABC-F family ATP-binding cassette domain-containing protein [Planctomycetes bacterium]|nr:ABC-F family ATP-binding cassette domain-containing protein [Planctomycetota bacterium]
MATFIQLKDLHKRFGPTVIFDGASALLGGDDKIGVIGRNGAGKTTLLKLLLGEEEPDGGEVVKGPQLRLGYLEQRDPYRLDETVLGFLLRYSGSPEWQCGKTAGRFQLKGDLLQRPIGDLSGGFQTRVKLAAMLLREPNFLLLDEPTNYLDLKTLLLLERFLRDFSGGFLIVSHDREFLKKTCLKTLEIELGDMTLFPGDVESYLADKEEQREQNLRYNKNIEAKRKHLQEFVDRYRVRSSTASRAQSKLRQMAKLESIEVEHPISTARIRIPAVDAKKGVALRCEDLSIGYPGKEVASGIRFEIEHGEHAAVLGDNGEGKTTFLRTIAGDLDSRGGAYRWGHRLRAAYYAQHVYGNLSERQEVISYLQGQAARDVDQQTVLDMAGSFLFQGDDVRQPISHLSGGERARLCLAGLLLARRPVLLLDEPTNHLDFETVEVLAEALRQYAGTILFTCHDRTFVRMVATSIVEVKNAAVTLYPADYETYVYRMEQEMDADDAAEAKAEPAAGPPPRKVTDYHLRKQLRSRIQKVKSRLREAEESIARKERERDAINRHYLENPLDDSPEKPARLRELSRLIEEEEARWIALGEELEELEREMGSEA